MITIISQDGTRIKHCTDVCVSGTHIYGTGDVALNEQELIGQEIIGIYTKERAKEVMGEIQTITEYINNVKIFGMKNCMNSFREIAVKYPKLLVTSVYAMPEK